MKKTLILIAGAACCLLFTACKKDIFGKHSNQSSAPTAPTTIKSTEVNDQNIYAGTAVSIGAFEHTTGGRTIDIRSDFTIGGTVNLSKVHNLSFAIRRGDGTLMYESDKNSNVSTVNKSVNWITLQKGYSYSTVVYADIDSGAVGTIFVKLHTQFRANDTTGWMNEAVGQTYTLQLYDNAPAVSSTGTSTKIFNGDFVTVSTVTITAPSNAPTAIKQLSWAATFANNSGSGIMRIDSLRPFFDGTDVTDLYKLVDDAGTAITSIAQNSPVKTFHAVALLGDGYTKIPLGSQGSFVLKGITRGFGGDSVISDVATIIAVKDAAAMPSGWEYLNRGTTGLNAKLYSSWAPSSSAKSANFVWSPMTAQPFNAGYGSPTKGWYNGYGIAFTATATILHS